MKHLLACLPILVASCNFSDAPKVIDKNPFIGCYSDGVSAVKITSTNVEIGGMRLKYAIARETIGPVLIINSIFRSDVSGRLMSIPSGEHFYRFQGSDSDLTIVIADNNSVVHQLRRLASCSG